MRYFLFLLTLLGLGAIGAVCANTGTRTITDADGVDLSSSGIDWPETVTVRRKARGRMSNAERLQRGQAPAAPQRLWRQRSSIQKQLDVGPSPTATSGSDTWVFANCVAAFPSWYTVQQGLGDPATVSAEDAAQQCASIEQSMYPTDHGAGKTYDFAIVTLNNQWACATDITSSTAADCSTAAGALYVHQSS